MKIILTTYPNINSAKKIANELLKKKLAACVNISSQINSYYRWQEQIQNNYEFLTIIKTDLTKLLKVKKIIQKTHPYDNPEIIEINGKILNKEYSEWFNESLGIF